MKNNKNGWDLKIRVLDDGILLNTKTEDMTKNSDYYLTLDTKGIYLCIGLIKDYLKAKKLTCKS